MRFLSFLSLLAPALASTVAGPGVSPATVVAEASPGDYINIDKHVTTPIIPPKPDIVLLVDTTGSMSGAIANIKEELSTIISTVTTQQPTAQFAVVSFNDLNGPDGFNVLQDLTDNEDELDAAVDQLVARGGPNEDWINALYELSAGGKVSWRPEGSKIIILVGDEPSVDPSGGHTLLDAINALNQLVIKVIAVNVGGLDSSGQASQVVGATGGVILGTDASAVVTAIISGLENIPISIYPSVSCSEGLSVIFSPPEFVGVPSGSAVTFHETVFVSESAPSSTLTCTVKFFLNDSPGGDEFIQTVQVKVNAPECVLCNPAPGLNLCHPTTSCAPTPFGTMCLTRPGFKADGARDDDTTTQWRLDFGVPGHEHRVAVRPGVSSYTECSKEHVGDDICQEVSFLDCSLASGGEGIGEQVEEQIVLGGVEL